MKKRTGLRINARKVDAEIGDEFKEFAKWLRRNYEFPIRVPVYLSNKKRVIGKDGKSYVSLFFAPFKNNVEPFIKIATGDYEDLVEELGKSDAIFNLLFSLATGVVKYRKWIDDNSGLDSYDADSDATILLQRFIDEG